MSRNRCLWCVAVGLLAMAAGSVGADEPSYRGRTLSEWKAMLEGDPKPQRRQAALMVIEALGAKDPATVRSVGKALRTDASDDVRQQAAQLLANLGPDAREGLDDLAASLKGDANARVRATAAAALGNLGAAGKSAVVLPVLTAALKDKDAKVRVWAAEAIAKQGEAAEAAVA